MGAREPEVQIQILNVDQMLNSEGATPEGGFAFERERGGILRENVACSINILLGATIKGF